MNLKRWIFLGGVWAMLWFAGVAKAEPGWDTDGIVQKAGALLKKDDFAGLETLVGEIKKKGYDIRQVYPELTAFYSVFAPRDTDDERRWLDQQTKLEAWGQAVPDSLAAKIALADWYIGYGWKARGTGYANTVTDGGWKLLAERLAKAAEILDSVPHEKVDDPKYYILQMVLARGQEWNRAKTERCFAEATALAPDFFPFYSAQSMYLLPRWNGTQADCAEFAAKAAATLPGEKGEILYALLVREESRWYGEDYFSISRADYTRAKNAFEAEIKRNTDAKSGCQNDLCYLAAIKGDKETAKALFLDLGFDVNMKRFGGMEASMRLFKDCGAQAEVDKAWALEQSGKLGEAEKQWLSFHADAPTSSWLLHFYERQGMEAGMRGSTLKSGGFPIAQVLDTAPDRATPDLLAAQAWILPMVGQWEKAEAAGQAFNQKRPWNISGLNTLLICAIQRGDKTKVEAVTREFVALKTNRAAYQVAQSVAGGAKTWEEVREQLIPTQGTPAFTGNKPWEKINTPPNAPDRYLPQAATAIVLHYLGQGDSQTAKTVAEQALPYCMESCEKALLASLAYGSLSRALQSPAATKP